MVFNGPVFDQPVLRAIVRFAAFCMPAMIWLRFYEPSGRDRLRFSINAKSGVITGVIVSIVWIGFHSGMELQLPYSVHSWLNVIILSPIAEEFLFRRVVIDYMATRTSSLKALLFSAILFSVMHLPWWILSGEKTAQEITALSALLFGYGIVFGVLYLQTRSLWASLIPHSVNNLIAESILS